MMRCSVCQQPTNFVEMFACSPGSEPFMSHGMIVTRGIAARQWCSWECWMKAGQSGLTGERSPGQLEIVL